MTSTTVPCAAAGSSPRRRGAPPVHQSRNFPGRIIPAQAGSTCSRRRSLWWGSDHPRAGGEHWYGGMQYSMIGGSSSRRRGARGMRRRPSRRRRIIPAQAGSTSVLKRQLEAQKDHPRAGGEHRQPASPTASPGDHPRAGGEHPRSRPLLHFGRGSSPRRRGARGHRLRRHPRTGIIPAQAGSTVIVCGSRLVPQDHPRAGGEHLFRGLRGRRPQGSSPRRRGAPGRGQRGHPRRGIIPAQAGSTVRSR